MQESPQAECRKSRRRRGCRRRAGWTGGAVRFDNPRTVGNAFTVSMQRPSPLHPYLLSAVLLVLPLAAHAQRELTDMERALRAAEGPRRLVIEASRLPGKPPVPLAPVTPVAERPASRPVAAVVPPRAGVADRPPAPVQATASPAPAPITTARPTPPAPDLPPVLAVPAAPEPLAPPAAVALAAPAAAPLPLPVAVAAEPVPLRLLNVVEPTVPRRLNGKLRGEITAVIRFTVNADGSVADAGIDESSHREMNESLLDAVRQWRYAPPGEGRAHAVRLTMKP
jgi:TonB family protein